ncbi:MAG: hypothetical protein HUN04_25015 [Desulfobacter sp.]|nr:MAG: hypothetical protein HUN04_25015 [Desulfobacter sp.]
MMEDIHDIRPPVMVGMDPALIRMGLWVAAGLAAAALIFILVRRLLKKKKSKSELTAIPVIPPYEIALGALERLGTASSEHSVKGAKSFYFELGRILKRYLGATWDFNGLEMTTQELGKQLKSVTDLPGPLKSEISLFQDICDPFRYAPDLVPDRARMDKDLGRGRELIESVERAKAQALQKQALNTGEGS